MGQQSWVPLCPVLCKRTKHWGIYLYCYWLFAMYAQSWANSTADHIKCLLRAAGHLLLLRLWDDIKTKFKRQEHKGNIQISPLSSLIDSWPVCSSQALWAISSQRGLMSVMLTHPVSPVWLAEISILQVSSSVCCLSVMTFDQQASTMDTSSLSSGTHTFFLNSQSSKTSTDLEIYTKISG